MKRLLLISLALLLVFFSVPIYAVNSNNDFVTVENGEFFLNESPYKALGTCLYPAHSANYDYIARTITEAKSNGITLIRAVDIWEGVYGSDDTALYSDSVWKRVDYIIKVCGENDMKVLLDISSFRQFLFYSPNRRDSYDPATFSLWSDVIKFICSRKNSFTTVKYSDDPTIMSYAFAGEPVCYGGSLNDWSDGYFTSRSVDDIKKSFYYISDELRANDPNHLISAGGLLHITPKGSDGLEFYKSVWSYKNIDYGSVHIYPASGEGEWANLSAYSDYCRSIGKPLMMEEFGDGGNDIDYKKQYMNFGFDRCFENDINIVVFWNWSIGSTFDTYSHMTDIMEIIHKNAKRLGYSGEFLPMREPTVKGKTIFSFEDGNTLFTPVSTDPGYNGNFSTSSEYATDGTYSLSIPVSFKENYQWYWMNYSLSDSVSLEGKYLAADVFIPENAAPLTAKFSINGVQQSDSGKLNNFIIPGRWNTIYLSISDDAVSPEGGGFAPNTAPDLSNVYSIGLLLTNSNGEFEGNVYVDNIRVGELLLFGDEDIKQNLTIKSVDISGNNISVDAVGGEGTLLYSYYIIGNGKIWFSDVYTKKNTATFEKLDSGSYNLRIYIEDSLKNRIVYTENLKIT